MKKQIITYFLLFCIKTIIAQTSYIPSYRQCDHCSNTGLDQLLTTQDFTYAGPMPYATNLIADNYGPRQNGTDIYDWHGGIDYNSAVGNSDMGDLVLALEGGTIYGSLGSGYKRLIIQAEGNLPNFGYGHFFITDGGNGSLPIRSGNCWLMLDSNGNRCIVMLVDGVASAIGIKQVGVTPGMVFFNDQNLTVSNTITGGSPLGPMGYSGIPNGTHMHLFSNPDNQTSIHDLVTKNPLQFVTYDHPSYDVKILRVTNYSSNTSETWTGPLYPGTNVSPIVIRPSMKPVTISGTDNNRYDKLYDLNQVEILLKKDYEAVYKLIMGATGTSDIRLGGRIGETMMPDYMYKDGSSGNGGGVPQIGNLSRQGIRPFSYATANSGHPYDDFYFTDFLTRIHVNDPTNGSPAMLSYCPMSTRYNDGKYKIKARVTNVRNDEPDYSNEQEITIDNYKPFIREVKVQVNGLEVYRRTWHCDDGPACQGMYLVQEVLNTEIKRSTLLSNEMWVTVTGSEPLTNLKINVNTLTDIPSTQQMEGGRIWQFKITPWQVNSIIVSPTIQVTCYNARDLAQNALISYSQSEASQSCVKIPKRGANSKWTDDRKPGADNLHFFNINCGNPQRNIRTEEPTLTILPDEEDCFGDQITWEVTQVSGPGMSDGAISLSINGGGIPPYTVTWSNGATGTELSQLAPGAYKAYISDALCCQKEIIITLCTPFTIDPPDITQPSYCGAADGVIYFRFGGPSGGVEPYTMVWNTGATGGYITNLPTGLYTLTITDAIGCSTIFDYTLQAPGEPVIIAETQPACSSLTNGSLIVNAYAPDGSGPFDFVWSSGQIYFDTYEVELNNLAAGDHCVTVTNNAGSCATSLCIDVEEVSAQTSLSINPKTDYSCPESATGSIQLQATGGIAPYQYTWDHVGLSGASPGNLSPGTYCVTITDYCGATVNDCIVVEADPDLVFDVTAASIQYASAAGGHDGAISLEPQPSGSYSFAWETGAGGNPVEGLAPGNYEVTVTNLTTGCQIVRSFEVGDCSQVADFDFIIVGAPAVAGSTTFQILLQENGGAYHPDISSQYQMWWGSPNGQTLAHGPTFNVEPTYTEDWVNVFVYNGCETKVKTKPIIRCGESYDDSDLARFFIVEKHNPCEGFSDGSVLLSIPHLATQTVSVIMNGLFNIPVNGEYVEIGNLSANQDYTLKISIDDCEFEYSFRLSTRETEKVFDHFANDVCFYAEQCGDITFDNELLQVPALLDWPGSQGSFAVKCSTPLLCEGIKRGDKNFSKRTVKAMEYSNTLQMALLSPIYPPNYIETLINFFPVENQECTKVKYCRGNLRPISRSPLGWGFSPNGSSIFDESTGCTFVSCGLFTPDYLVCPQDADIFGGLNLELNNCFPRRVNMFELWLNYAYLSQNEPGFAGSDLANFIYLHKDNPKIKCASVVYCQRDFTRISDNLNAVNCGVPILYCGNFVGNSCETTPIYNNDNEIVAYKTLCESDYGTTTCPLGGIAQTYRVQIQCVQDAAPTPSPALVCPTFLQESSTTNNLIKVILDPYQNETLVGIGLSQDEFAINPKGLVDTEAGRVFDNFYPLDNQVKKEPIAKVVQFVEDWDKEMEIYVQQASDGEAFELIYEDSASIWTRAIKAAGQLQILHLSSTPGTDEIVIGGVCDGYLAYGTEMLRTSGDLSAFCMRVQKNATLNSIQFIDHINANGKVVFSENRGGKVLVAGKYESNMSSGGIGFQLVADSGFFSIQLQNSASPALLGDFPSSGNLQLKEISYASAQNQATAFAFWGNGTIQMGGQMLSSANDRILMATISGSTLQWQSSIPVTNMNTGKFDIGFGEKDLLFTGFTFNNSISPFSVNFQSEGQEDIALLAIDNTGAVTWQQSVGTSGNENVSELLYDHGVLYFGGEFSGEIGDREIGQIIFSNLMAANSRAYISEIVVENGGVQTLNQSETGRQNLISIDKQTEGKIKIFPNPVSQELTVTAYGLQVSFIEIRDQLGRLVLFQESNENKEWRFDFSKIPSGMYWVGIHAPQGKILYTKKIIKH